MVALTCSMYDAYTVLAAASMTFGVTLALTVYAWTVTFI